ncbi:MAG TPA: glucose-1-phosphate thymidylyltransferase RfbA, partial [bacterium]|nr:glucose-1-phosphate thymidylyltransferase RfbA [bacterium]
YVYNKPMIYYPLSTLILGGIKDILIITTPDDAPMFKKLLGDGKHIGLNLQYAEQPKPEGLAQAFIIGESFINNEPVSLILGDNLFYGYLDFFKRAIQNTKVGATIFGYVVQDPERYGVVEFDAQDRVISLEEKPKHPKSHYAVPGLYVYDNQVVQIAKSLKPSPRGELEITDLNRVYLELGQLMIQKIGRGVAWLDTGTPQALLEANNFIGAVEQRQGMMIGCIEEAALRAGFLTIEQYQKMLEQIPKSPYRQYLERIAIEP